MRKLKLLTVATLAAFAFVACDEGSDTTAPTVTGSINGNVSIEGSGAAGVTVTLSSGSSTTTDAAGNYTFSGVDAGTYVVTISGFPTDATFASTSQSAVIATNGQIVTVNFSGSFVRTSAIVGSVAVTGVGPLDGVTVTLSGAASMSATTDGTGTFSFTGLRAGSYTVAISGFDAVQYTFPSTSQAVTVGAGATQVVAFTGSRVATAVISGALFLDENDKNNVFDGAILEEFLKAANVAVTLKGPDVGTSVTTQTDANGEFRFEMLVAGTYSVSINPTDPDIPAFVAFGGDTTSVIVTITTGGQASVYFPFDIVTQTIDVHAFTGRDAVSPGHNPVPGVIITLYPTELDAIGATNALGVDTTGAAGATTFTFKRADDTSPQAGLRDNIVFAQVTGQPASNFVPNGEVRIEIGYDPRVNVAQSPDTFDYLNTAVSMNMTARGINMGPVLTGWNVALFRNDSLNSTQNGVTNSSGVASFSETTTAAGLPDTFFIRLSGAQPNAQGHSFSQTPEGDEGDTAGRYLRLVHTGFDVDPVMVGYENVKFLDADIIFKVHHERDDSTDVPIFTLGDDQVNVDEIEVRLWSVPSSGAAPFVIARDTIAAGNTADTFPNFLVDSLYALSAGPIIVANKDVLNDTLVSVTGMDGSVFATMQCPLQGNVTGAAGCSTFAYKYNNTSITGLVRAADGTDADGVRVQIMPTSDFIQPQFTDSTRKVSGGSYGFSNLREGPYTVMVFDSVNANGDSIWAFFGTNNPAGPVDLQDNADADIVNFVPITRMDTKVLGTIINDRDADNNTIDPNEALANATVSLYRGVGINADSLVGTVTSDSNGEYAFSKLREGFYTIHADPSTTNQAVVISQGIDPSGMAVDTQIVRTAATTTGLGNNSTRQVGDTVFGSAGQPSLARWNFGTSDVLFDDPTHFTFLFSNTTARGTAQNAGNPVAGMTVTLQRCRASAGFTSPPTGGTCTTFLPGAPQNVSTDANGQYEFTNLQEGVYQVTFNPTTAGFTTATPATLLYILQDSGDIEVPANPIVIN